MANSKFSYVKGYEVENEVMFRTLIVIRVVARDFRRFSKAHEFGRQCDEQALNLMNSCAITLMEKFKPNVVFAYGFGEEYSFVFKKSCTLYNRRDSKLQSLIVSFFTSAYVMKWKEFFPHKDLKYPPIFQGKVVPCASMEVLQYYLAWRQQECHMMSQYNICFWKLVESGISEKEADEKLKGTDKEKKNELLFKQFGINYNSLPQIFRQGSCILMSQVEDIVKFEDGVPIKRLKTKAQIVHSKNIAGKSFWDEYRSLLKDLGDGIAEDVSKIEKDCIASFSFDRKLLPSTWIVVRIDGHHFGGFAKSHEFEKPNDERGLELMNTCAVAVLLELEDVIFAYGHSDEYSFVLKKDSQFCERKLSDIVSTIVSLFTSSYVMKWKTFFPLKELMYPPSFDGRAVCYPSTQILQDYLAWRQVDCHINNQYNTCFWMLVKSGKSPDEAKKSLEGTLTKEKYELLSKQFGIKYNTLPPIFRQGSCAFREVVFTSDNGVNSKQAQVAVKHCDIILPHFWKANAALLGEGQEF